MVIVLLDKLWFTMNILSCYAGCLVVFHKYIDFRMLVRANTMEIKSEGKTHTIQK